ncbi:MAG: 1,6-anhydro-N-acetylmuramyl-L-alanine amidase AmpD [Kiritimatiellia bacterium]|nr:1,6-anhydro-N-acetylmuramyl-L-alanine amidase AmpD [Pseudomonadales bacterium]MDP6470899.1 1,6-anhydro-N-acetylmuramyl-L-alanine amidase AmpD [Pseudomonadales bacterium]MDP6825916.1 1,6-anhydro-N-acetylmuramyl-L-alanine amidase AmpD [Pseudomonadales bacterium]MDP7024544.1 1,6-anhydro-N-acetylmuramyl-L-alanine amidase AmpD [Kiritimatiellia bacterium]
MRVDKHHWFSRIQRKPSPNCDPRPDRRDIGLVVVHNVSLPPGEFGGSDVEALFLNRLDISKHPSYDSLASVPVSAHLYIDRRGRCTQFVALDQRAWHAGVSRWRGRSNCNDFSIGIELEGTDERPYTRAQYRRLGAVLAALFKKYPRLSPDAVVGHQEVAPGRKTDPGPAFDWPRALKFT